MLRVLAPAAAAPGPWSKPSPFGPTYRPATDILMSAYDTNAAATDHTAAFQNALTAAATLIAAGSAKVRIILDSRQKYTIGGAVTAGANGQWAQVPLPWSNTHVGEIQLVGIPQGRSYHYIAGGGTVIESTLGSAPAYSSSVGIASIFGGPASFCSTRTTASMYPNGFSYIRFGTQDITIRSAAPVICGIDCGWVTGFSFDGQLTFDTDQMAAALPASLSFALLTVCTAPQAVPLITPFSLDWFGTLGDTLVCSGWLGGPYLGELFHAREVFVFFTAGAALYLDAAAQPARIEYLIDWNNAYGIASYDPTSATPISPPLLPLGSGSDAYGITPVRLGQWEIQCSQGGNAPVATQRVYDILDVNDYVIAESEWHSTNDGGTSNLAPVIYGKTAGSASGVTGLATFKRIRRNAQQSNTGTPTIPASATAIRNPFARDAFVSIIGGTVSAVNVDGIAAGYTTVVMVPANGIIAATYSVAPTWKWQVL